jgi:hypothetical protein
MDPERVKAITEWPTLESFKDVQVFVGFANFYRRFITKFLVVIAPITDLLKGAVKGKKIGPFEWTDAAEMAKRQLCELFTSAPMLRHFDPTLKSRLETDASIRGVSGIFSQLHEDGNWHPVAFWSRKLTAVEKNYPTYDHELLAIVQAVQHWRHYIEGSMYKLQVITDHNNLRGFLTTRTLSRRQAGWAMKLAGFDLEITHRAGKLNPADGPSRYPRGASGQGEERAEDMLPTLHKILQLEGTQADRSPALEDSQKTAYQEAGVSHLIEDAPGSRQRDDGDAMTEGGRFPFVDQGNGVLVLAQRVTRTQVKKASGNPSAYAEPSESLTSLILEAQRRDPWVERKCSALATLPKRRRGNKWTFEEGHGLRYNNRIFVPPEPAIRAELLKIHHDDPLAGHFGKMKTLELLSRAYFWLQMEKEVKEYINSCAVCQGTKALKQRPAGALQSLPRPEGPWEELTMDFITGLPPSRRGEGVFDAIWVVVDRYTKMARYVPTQKTLTASLSWR